MERTDTGRGVTSQDVTSRGARIGAALAGLNGLLAVGFGAFAAHGVSDPPVRELLRTGAGYEMAHAAAGLAAVAWGQSAWGRSAWPAGLFGAGGLVFGGSLYLLAFTGARAFGAVTPLGGLLMLAGWGLVAWGAVRR